jgi:hypothetical protein
VPLQQLLNQQSFGPDEIKVLSSVFEEALRELRLVDRTDPATLLVAKRIMNLRSRASVIQPDCARVPLRGSDVSPYRAALSVSRNPLSCAVLGKSDPPSMSERSCAQCPVVGILCAQEHPMERVEVFHLLQDVLFAQQPFLVAELNP